MNGRRIRRRRGQQIHRMHTAVPERRMKGNNALKGELNSQREEPRALKAYAELQVKNVENTNQF